MHADGLTIFITLLTLIKRNIVSGSEAAFSSIECPGQEKEMSE